MKVACVDPHQRILRPKDAALDELPLLSIQWGLVLEYGHVFLEIVWIQSLY